MTILNLSSFIVRLHHTVTGYAWGIRDKLWHGISTFGWQNSRRTKACCSKRVQYESKYLSVSCFNKSRWCRAESDQCKYCYCLWSELEPRRWPSGWGQVRADPGISAPPMIFGALLNFCSLSICYMFYFKLSSTMLYLFEIWFATWKLFSTWIFLRLLCLAEHIVLVRGEMSKYFVSSHLELWRKICIYVRFINRFA